MRQAMQVPVLHTGRQQIFCYAEQIMETQDRHGTAMGQLNAAGTPSARIVDHAPKVGLDELPRGGHCPSGSD